MPVEEKTGAYHPEAVFVIWALQLSMSNGQVPSGEFEVRGFVDDNALATGKEPFVEDPPSAFTAEEIGQLQAQFAVAVMGILAKRAEYSKGVVVTK